MIDAFNFFGRQAPEFESKSVRISIPENAELGAPLYAANAHDKDSGKMGTVRYRLTNVDDMHTTNSISLSSSSLSNGDHRKSAPNLFSIDSVSGHLTLQHHLDYETAQRHALLVTASDLGEPSMSTNLTILVEVQDVNDNEPVFERSEYAISVIESTQINAQVNIFFPKCNTQIPFFLQKKSQNLFIFNTKFI